MRVDLKLSVKCSDGLTAERLERALSPDNRMFPKGQRFASGREGATLTFSVSSPRLMPALSTLESLLSDVRLFQDMLLLSI